MKKKYEAIISFHVRFDANTENKEGAGDIVSEITRRLRTVMRRQFEGTESSGYAQVKFVETPVEVEQSEITQDGYVASVSWASENNWVLDEAGQNRHNPNVFMVGRMMTTSQAISEFGYNSATVSPSETDLYRRALPFDTQRMTGEPGLVTLPTLPASTMRRIIDTARHRYSDDMYTTWFKRLKTETIETIEGLFEDGLPVDTETSEPEMERF